MRKTWLCTLLAGLVLILLLCPRTASGAPERGTIIHVVQRGEMLSLIARRYGIELWTLARANGITNPNRIYVGQRLVVPTGRPAVRAHVVRPGETLTQIALRYGVNAWTIARANGIWNLNLIYVGQRLVIPGAPPPRAAPKPAAKKPVHPAPKPTPTPGPMEGWYGEFFPNETLDGAPVASHHVPWIGFEWKGDRPLPGVPVDHFSARWTTRLQLKTDHYRFCAMADDGVRIWVEDELVLNEWHPNNGVAYCGTVWAKTGVHDVRVEYFEQGGEALIYVWWEPH